MQSLSVIVNNLLLEVTLKSDKILPKIESFLQKIWKSMLASTEKLKYAGFGERVFTDKDLARFFGGTPARRYGLVNKALAKGELIRIRRGVYILAEKYRPVKLSRFLVANQTVLGSYISFESALSYHGWIPERVAVVMSVIYRGRSRSFDTPLAACRRIQLSYCF